MSDLTVELLESIITTMPKRVEPRVMLVSPYFRAVYQVFIKSVEEGWNWRRTKRELRRPLTSTYSRRAA